METKKPRRKQRVRSPHPGVVLAKRTLPSGSVSWRARYQDPETGATVWQTLEARLSTAEKRTHWAKEKSAALADRRAEIAAGIGVAPVERTTIAKAVEDYLDVAKVRLRKRTLNSYQVALDRFTTWAEGAGLVHVDELGPAHLADLRATLIKASSRVAAKGGARGARTAGGPTRGPVTINRELTTIGTILSTWRRAELVDLSSDQIRDGLRKLPTQRALPVYLPPATLKRLFESALRHDQATYEETRAEHRGERERGTTPRHPEIAPFLALLLLTGMRRGEALTLRWSDVDLEALDSAGTKVGEIRLRPEEVKTRTARVIGLEVSPALRRILAALRLRAGGEGAVFPSLTAEVVKRANDLLVSTYGAPAFRWKDLRSTCASFLTNAPGVFGAASAFMSAKQLGHSVVVAEKRYAGLLRGIPRDARTLEAAMQIEKELAAVLKSVGDAGRADASRAS